MANISTRSYTEEELQKATAKRKGNKYHCVLLSYRYPSVTDKTACGLILNIYPRTVSWDYIKDFVRTTLQNKHLTRCKACESHKTVGLAFLRERIKQ